MQTHNQPSSIPPTTHTPHKRPREPDPYSPGSGSGGGGQRVTASDLLNAITSSTSNASSSSPTLPAPGSGPAAGGMGAAPPSSTGASAPGSKSGLSPSDYYSGQYPITKVSRTSASPPPTFGNQRTGGPVRTTPQSLTSGAVSPLQQSNAAGPNTATTHTTQEEHQHQQQPTTNHPLLCTLPPTCNRRATPIASTKDLESHYAKYHAHVCEERGCGCVFPDARLLELHQRENHDPLAAVLKDRGGKIFACHLVTCDRNFLNPKARRLHLIEAHKYPKEYFFSVTNKGVGGLLRKWGDGASMIRKEWKPRAGQNADDNTMLEDDEDDNDEEDDGDEVKVDRADKEKMDTDGNEDKDQVLDFASSRTRNEDVKSTIARQEATTMSHNHNYRQGSRGGNNGAQVGSGDANDDGLANAMSSLSLVPTSIRFGRGGKGGGFANNNRHNYPDGHGQAGRGGSSNGRSGTGHVRSGSHSHDRVNESEGNTGSENQKQQNLGTGRGQQQQTPQIGYGGHGGHHPQRGLGWAARTRPGVFAVRGRGRGRA